MNYDRVPKGFRWMQTTSFFHAAYEALLVNELRYLQLIEHKVSLIMSPQLCACLTYSPCSLGWTSKYPPPLSSRLSGFTLKRFGGPTSHFYASSSVSPRSHLIWHYNSW